ncbi:MAG: septum formation initiator family protein [Candidatus Nomurabacteria bacterium]|jgi:cell division protein FtsB|nr:septum formation initiator family protein [Candidatus Nomurabacteria bacterium]
MDEKPKARLKKYLTRGNLILIFAALVAGVWGWQAIGSLNKNYQLQQQVDQGNLENQVADLQNQNLQLQQSYYQTDEYLELQARDKLNKALPGEHLVILPKTGSSDQSTEDVLDNVDSTAQTTQAVDNSTNFEKWMRFLFGKE